MSGLSEVQLSITGNYSRASSKWVAIAELVAAAAILYIDETGWKIGRRSCYTWIFSTLSLVLFKCGVGRGKAVLSGVLGDRFEGIGVTDDYSAYQSQFSEQRLPDRSAIRTTGSTRGF